MGWQEQKKVGKQPSRAARERVHAAFDREVLADMCETWDFREHADRVELLSGVGRDGEERERFYWHGDNGADVLAIAHLDTVQGDRRCQVTDTASGLLATSGALDDRLGVYVILDLLPKLGITCDVLLTTDEEIGASTASAFETDKEYRWMFQFDRGGTDVVMYDYETVALAEAVRASGAQVGQGIYSDICYLDFLGCAGINWGVGYQDYHSARSHAWLDDTFRMVARFAKFYKANRDDHWSYDGAWWKDYDKDEEGEGDASDEESERGEGKGDAMLTGPGYVEADCGHDIDIYDPHDFREWQGCVWCRECAKDGGFD